MGPEFARGRGFLFLALGILFFIIGIAVTMTTYRYARVSWSIFEILSLVRVIVVVIGF